MLVYLDLWGVAYNIVFSGNSNETYYIIYILSNFSMFM